MTGLFLYILLVFFIVIFLTIRSNLKAMHSYKPTYQALVNYHYIYVEDNPIEGYDYYKLPGETYWFKTPTIEHHKNNKGIKLLNGEFLLIDPFLIFDPYSLY